MSHSISYRRILHKMGYYNYQRGLIVRHLNEEGSWNTHLTNCRNFILKSLEFYKPSVVSIFGSGWLLDLPLMEINEFADEINLVDIIHPPEVKSQVANMKKVILREEDVTGGLIEEVWERASRKIFLNKLRSFEEIRIKKYQPGFDPGLVISLNILTQLEVLPVEFLRKRSRVKEEAFLQLRKEIQQNHISFLKSHKSILLTDHTEVITESSGNNSEIKSVLVDLPEGKLKEDWTWYFELKNSDFYRKKSVFKVSALMY
jgi:hypothetical protein